MRRSLVLCGIALALPTCAPKTERPTEVLLFIDTDAAVESGAPASVDSPAALFDRLEIAAFEPGHDTPCTDCVRTFAPTARDFAGGGVSFGLPVRAQTKGYRVRARLFRAANTLDGLPREENSLAMTVELPPVFAGSKIERSLVLLTESIGSPVGTLEEPAATLEGHASASRVGTWAGARRVPCAAPPPPGEVCVPGGAFWMGSPLAEPVSDAASPRLVVLSPFYLDAYEVRVRDARAAGMDEDAVYRYRPTTGDPTFSSLCTFTEQPETNEELPANCVFLDGATAYCAGHGKLLPTEAQLEYVEGGLVSTPFPWGYDVPSCEDAIWGRSATSLTKTCLSAGRAQPRPVGSGKRDRLDLPTGTIFDLAGNIAEFTRDKWNRASEPCWSERRVFVDPTCTIEGVADADEARAAPDMPSSVLYVVRGGSWEASVPEMRSARRIFQRQDFPSFNTGFRCARVAEPGAP